MYGRCRDARPRHSVSLWSTFGRQTVELIPPPFFPSRPSGEDRRERLERSERKVSQRKRDCSTFGCLAIRSTGGRGSSSLELEGPVSLWETAKTVSPFGLDRLALRAKTVSPFGLDRLAIRSTFFFQKAYPIRNMYRSGATLLVRRKARASSFSPYLVNRGVAEQGLASPESKICVFVTRVFPAPTFVAKA